MSLSQQTARVAEAGKSTLKTLLQKFGVTVGDELIDQYPELASEISNKLLPDNLLSDSTATKYGLPAGSVPNAVFEAISQIVKPDSGNVSVIKTGTYTGNGQENLVFNLGFYFDAIFIFLAGTSRPVPAAIFAGIFYNGNPQDDGYNSQAALYDNSGVIVYGSLSYTIPPTVMHLNTPTASGYTGWRVKGKTTKQVTLVAMESPTSYPINLNNTRYSYVAIGTNTPRA